MTALVWRRLLVLQELTKEQFAGAASSIVFAGGRTGVAVERRSMTGAGRGRDGRGRGRDNNAMGP